MSSILFLPVKTKFSGWTRGCVQLLNAGFIRCDEMDGVKGKSVVEAMMFGAVPKPGSATSVSEPSSPSIPSGILSDKKKEKGRTSPTN